jgi:hypothetical protein
MISASLRFAGLSLCWWSLRLMVIVMGLATDAAFVLAQPDQQVKIAETIWGFDRRVVPSQFMPLSILLDNLSDEPIEAVVSLRQVSGMVRDVGGTTSQPVFLGPNSRRWVQFYPYISSTMASWKVSLVTAEGRRQEFDDLDQPRSLFRSESGAAGSEDDSLPTVILDPPGVGSRIPTTVRHMPAEIFPPYATATSGLYALYLDHVPDWETPRQQALLSWLKHGGQLHLLLDQNSQPLHFSGPLAPLNDPFPRFPVGQGTVFRHVVQRSGVTEQMVRTASSPLRESADETPPAYPQSDTVFASRPSIVDDDEVFEELRGVTQPEHAWWAIFLLSMLYVGLIFPGCWLLSRNRTLHFMATYGAIAGLAALFSLFFLAIGRRGYGESTVMHTLALAQAEDATNWSVFSYDNLFVTEGDLYSIDDRDHEALLASGATDERVDVDLISGNQAGFSSRIPPFSSQALISRRRLTLPDWQVQLLSIDQTGPLLSSLTVGFGGAFPVGPEVQYFVLFGRTVHEATVSAGRQELVLKAVSHRLQDFLVPPELDPAFVTTPLGIQRQEPEKETAVEKCYRRALPQLTQRMLAGDFVRRVPEFRLAEDRLRLLIYAPLPKELELHVSAAVRRAGRVLYVRELVLSGSGNPAPALEASPAAAPEASADSPPPAR